jgi:manganese/zinc/iron transport system substrate-binding protein
MDNRLILLISFLLVMVGCEKQSDKQSDKLTITTTTGMIEDVVKNIIGDKGAVEALMGPGVDPHLYKATQGDLQKLTSSSIIFYNGLHLEGKMGDVLETLAHQKPVVAVSENIEDNLLRKVPEFNNNYDPHIWFNVALWSLATEKIANYMQEYDSANAEYYKQNAILYLAKLKTLHEEVKQQIATIPENQRVLITAHDAFGYFGDAYNIEVKGLQGISTLSEYGLRDVSNLVDYVINNKIKAVFVETSVSNKAINAVVEGCKQRGYDVIIGGNLYSDAMGQKGTPEGTYIGMVRANVKTIVEALK